MSRPDIRCTFDVMNSCTRYTLDERLRAACTAGARDAHLQNGTQQCLATSDEIEAYTLGWNSTVTYCSDLHSLHVHHHFA